MKNRLILSAFADEYADGLKEQCEALNKFGIDFYEGSKTMKILLATYSSDGKEIKI